jgi:hypothetical protein
MSMQNIRLAKTDNIPVDSLLTKAYPIINIIADRLRDSPHISAENFHTLQLPSLLSPRCREVKPAVQRDAQFHNTHNAHLMTRSLQSPCLFQAEQTAVRREERREFKNVHALILVPALYVEVFNRKHAERFNEGTCQTSISNQRNVVINSSTTNLVAIAQLTVSTILGDINHKIETMV